MAQGALGAAGVRRVGYGLDVGRSVRTAGGAGAYCVATRTACFSRDDRVSRVSACLVLQYTS